MLPVKPWVSTSPWPATWLNRADRANKVATAQPFRRAEALPKQPMLLRT